MWSQKAYDLALGAALSAPGVGGRDHRRFRIGACLYTRNKILAVRHNSYKTHPHLAKYSIYPFQHAEAACILAVGYNYLLDRDCYMVTIRARWDGYIGSAKPCQSLCQPLLTEAGVLTCYYTTSDQKIESIDLQNI